MAARIVDKQEKRDLILDSSLKVFSRRGFSQATMQDIAAEADIGKGTIYEYFRSKDEIIQNTWMAFMRRMGEQLEEILAAPLPGVEKLRHVLAAFLEIIQGEDAGVIRIMFNFWAEAMRDTSQSNVMFVEMNKYYGIYRQAMAAVLVQGIEEGVFRPGLNVISTASILIGMLDGLLAQWILDPDALDYQGMGREIPELVLQGIGLLSDAPVSFEKPTTPRRKS